MFNSNDFFKYIPKKYNVEDIPFSLIALTDELAEKVSACDTYEGMVSLAADYGLSCDNVRIVDDEELATHISRFWKAPEVKIECETSIKHQVGLKVCEISGLSEMLAEQLELEKPEEEEEKDTVVDESFIVQHGEADLEQVIADADAHAAA